MLRNTKHREEYYNHNQKIVGSVILILLLISVQGFENIWVFSQQNFKIAS